MSLLFYTDLKNNLILRPECVKLCPSLSVLKEKELLYIILAYDYQSIYRKFPDHERKRKAMFHAFDDNMPDLESKPIIKTAIIDYISLQYDPKIELIKKYQKRVDKYMEDWEEDDNASSAKKYTEAITITKNAMLDLENEVTESIINKNVIKGGMELSFLETTLADNQKIFKSVTAFRKDK